MKRNSTLAWACAAWLLIGLCGCSSSNPFKKKPSPGSSDLGYKPTDTVPTPGTSQSVAGANISSGPAANPSLAGTSYPSTGMGATPIGGGNKPAWNPTQPAAAARAGVAPAWQPPANSTASTGPSAASQEGYYPTNYPGGSAPAANGLASGAASSSTKPAPDLNAAAGNQFAAAPIVGGSPDSRFSAPATPDLRTADTRSSVGGSAVPWAARNETPSAPAATGSGNGVAPWAAAGAPAAAPITPAANGPEAWASSQGSSTVGQDAAKSAAPRRDPHYRPGQTGDFHNNAPLSPSGAQAAPRSSASITPAGFASPAGESPRRVEKVATEITPAAPWSYPEMNSGSGGGSASEPAATSVPWAAGGPNADVLRR